jgi:hypothetical protein
MAKRDIVDDLTDIVHPLPGPIPADADENTEAGHDAWTAEVKDQRRVLEADLRLSWEEGDENPLLRLISTTRAEMREAEKRMRMLVAYGREFVEPRPYRLDDLAQATGMSISGTRTSYDADEVADVADRIGRQPRTRLVPRSS